MENKFLDRVSELIQNNTHSEIALISHFMFTRILMHISLLSKTESTLRLFPNMKSVM